MRRFDVKDTKVIPNTTVTTDHRPVDTFLGEKKIKIAGMVRKVDLIFTDYKYSQIICIFG